jgi:hypothetical protein
MTDPIETTALPALAGFAPGGADIKIVRPLTDVDLSNLRLSKTVHRLAAPAMQMFGILTLNHGALHEFAAELRSPGADFRDPQMQLNRHMLNYLASANALLGHFSTTFTQRTREVGKPTDGFEKFCREIKAESDVFEFFCEFRNHALHVGLPVGNTQIAESLTAGRTVSVVHKTADLLRGGSRDLKRCRLLSAVDEIDLLPELEAFHAVFMTRVFKFIVDCLMPGLVPASRFHATLAAEVKAVGVDLRPVIMTERIRSGDEFKWVFEWIPEDFLKELGISIQKKAQEDTQQHGGQISSEGAASAPPNESSP